MVCAVKDCSTGQILPSCTTLPTEGMNIDTESDEVRNSRNLSLELLLSDHRADCEAPCSMVCPQGLDIEQMLNLYDTDKHKEAFVLIADSFTLPVLGCDECKVPCEKICRRASIDKAVQIREIIKELAGKYPSPTLPTGEGVEYVPTSAEAKKENKGDKTLYQSRLGRFTTREKEWLKENITTPSGCLHCACTGRDGCKLRLHATAAGIKRPRYEASSTTPVMRKQHVTGEIWFEPAKCIRCGLCVYNTKNGFTFKDRGFGMQIVIPDENKANVNEEIVGLCPTGALYSG